MSYFLLALTAAVPIKQQVPVPSLKTDNSVGLEASYQDFGKAGNRWVAESRFKLVRGPATIVLSPKLGTRENHGRRSNGTAMVGDLYLPLSDSIITKTSVQLADRSATFARLDVSEQFTIGIAPKTNLSAGVRYAQFELGDEVTFVSGGVRQYFSFGSLAYTMTAAHLSGSGRTGLGHMVQLRVNDGHGDGYTQLWTSISSGAQEFEWARNDRMKVRSLVVRRTQPIANDLALVGKIGYANYRSPANRHTGLIAGLGIEYRYR